MVNYFHSPLTIQPCHDSLAYIYAAYSNIDMNVPSFRWHNSCNMISSIIFSGTFIKFRLRLSTPSFVILSHLFLVQEQGKPNKRYNTKGATNMTTIVTKVKDVRSQMWIVESIQISTRMTITDKSRLSA
jgi:hypothetical protein